MQSEALTTVRQAEKRPFEADGSQEYGPPSPKKAGIAVTVKIEGNESTSKAKEHSPKKDAKDKSPSPRKVKAEKDESAEKEASRLKKEKQEEERQKMKVLVSNFTEDQLDRYEMFRRASFPKAAVRRLMQSISGCTIPQNVVIAMAGIAKVFVGEIVEESLDVMEKGNEEGPIQPKHIREAVRKLRAKGTIINTKYKKKMF